jgi:predicted Zn-dependent protease
MALKLPEKDVLAAKLIDYPLLNSILRMLLYERLFRVILVLLVLLLGGTGLFLAKIWTASPKGFDPVIKLSGLDYVQAWSLRQTALKQQAEGRFDDALYSWRVAIANNPVNPDLIRGCLNHLLDGTDKRKCTPAAVSYSRWLMRLTETNLADLELSVRLYEHFGVDDLTVRTVSLYGKQLSPTLEGCYLKALFNRRAYDEFGERWKDAKLRGVQFSDPDLALYHAAYLEGWGLPSDANAGKQLLEKAKSDPNRARQALAHQLQLKVSDRLVDAEAYRTSLAFLEESRQDRLADHFHYWELLLRLGRKKEAAQLMDAHVTPPNSGEETVLLAQAYYDLGQQDKSREILKQYSLEFSTSEAVWLTYANLLTVQKRWDDLISLALLIRNESNPVRDILGGYSYYLEGLAELRKNRLPTATNAFNHIPASRAKDKTIELMLAEKLEAIGFPDVSKAILLNLQKEVVDNEQFWVFLAKTAFESRDPDVLVSAMASAYKLRTNDLGIVNNYAAALLATRQRPDEALRLTSRVLEKFPDAAGPRINQAEALLQNQKPDDAEPILRSIEADKLSDEERSQYYLVCFELYLDQHRFDDARKALGGVQPRHLLPTEVKWMSEAKKQLPPPPQG